MPVGTGLAIAGIGGGLMNMFRGSPSVPDPATLQDLRRSNPELFQALMQIQARAGQLQRMADRRTGITPSQQIQIQDSQRALNQQMANRGLVGTSAGAQMGGDMAHRMRAQAMNDAYNQRMQALQMAGGADQQFLSGAHQALAPLNQQRMGQYQGDMQNRMGAGQFFSGLLGAGLNLGATEAMTGQAPFPGIRDAWQNMWSRPQQQPAQFRPNYMAPPPIFPQELG